MIAAIWRELIGAERVGLYDNFMDIGGNSLLAMQAIAKIREATGIQLRPVRLMSSSLAQLAADCDQSRAAASEETPKEDPIAKRLFNKIKGRFQNASY